MDYKFDKKHHLHLLGGKPLTGTSSIGDVLFKPLAWWASGKAVETLGWAHPKIKKGGKVVGEVPREERLAGASKVLDELRTMPAPDYLALLDKAYRAHDDYKKERAKGGTDLHAELERFVKAEMRDDDGLTFDDKILPFIRWSQENVKRFLWSEAHCCSERLWVGGISDTGAELKDGSIAVLDFKSSKEAYPTQFIQDAGYAIQINENGLFSEDGKENRKLDRPIDKLIIVPFGAEVVIPEIRGNIKDYKKGFEEAVGLYRLLGLEKQVAR